MEKGADLATFLVGFEAHMRNYEVPIHKWHKALVLALNEEAVKAYGRAPEGSQLLYSSYHCCCCFLIQTHSIFWSRFEDHGW